MQDSLLYGPATALEPTNSQLCRVRKFSTLWPSCCLRACAFSALSLSCFLGMHKCSALSVSIWAQAHFVAKAVSFDCPLCKSLTSTLRPARLLIHSLYSNSLYSNFLAQAIWLKVFIPKPTHLLRSSSLAHGLTLLESLRLCYTCR